MKLTFLALLSLLAVVAFAEVQENVAIDETERSGYRPVKCPCTCYVHPYSNKARHECRKRIYKHCEVSYCKDRYHKRGSWCCDAVKPTKSATPTPTPTPSNSPKPKCPCKCTEKRWARKDCRYLSPYCKVTNCEDKIYRDSYGRIKHSTPQFECCDYHSH